MKSLSKRNKIVLGIVGIVVVVAVIGLVITQPPVSALFGTTVLAITPSNPSISIPASVELGTNMGVNCTWSTSDPRIVLPQMGWSTGTRQRITAATAGQTTITAACGYFGTATTTVTVTGPTPTPVPAPSLSPATLSLLTGSSGTLTILNPPTGGLIGVSPASSNEAIAKITGASGNTLTVTGVGAGQATITVNWSTGAKATATVTVTGPTPLNPATVTLHKNQGYQEYHVDGAKSCSEWTSDPTGVIVIAPPSSCGTTCVWAVPFAVGSTKLKTRCFMEITQNYVNYEATINVVSP